MTREVSAQSPYAESFGAYLKFVRTEVFRESLRDFAKRVTLSAGYIHRLELGGAGVPRRETVILIANRVGQPEDTWLVKAGFAPKGDATATESEYFMLKLKRLTQDQIETLVDLADTMAAKNDRKGK